MVVVVNESRVFTLLFDFLFLVLDEELSLLSLDLFIVLEEDLRDARLGDSDRDDLDAWSPLVTVSLQSMGQHFI